MILRFRQYFINTIIVLSFSLAFTHSAQLPAPPHQHTGPAESAWDFMRREFKLNTQVSNPEVKKQLKWLSAHPSYMKEFSQAKPYLYFILNELKKRKLPAELALIPMIESTYDPFVYSHVGAAGLWQIMPRTAKDLGLQKDWWADHRRHVISSTHAALNYLHYLHGFFHGNWELAIASYDAGEGTILRAVRRAKQSPYHANFWTLKVPLETRNYVPRLLAMAEVIRNPKKYNVSLPPIPYEPYFEEIQVSKPIDLNQASKLAGMSHKEFIKLNPAFNRFTTTPSKPYTLLLPKTKVKTFYENLISLSHGGSAKIIHHAVVAGENLQTIARRYYTSVQMIRSLNRLHTQALKPGQTILVPKQNGLASASPSVKPMLPTVIKVVHIVQKNDDLKKIAGQYQTSSNQVLAWNHMEEGEPIKTGQQLIIWRRMPTSAV